MIDKNMLKPDITSYDEWQGVAHRARFEQKITLGRQPLFVSNAMHSPSIVHAKCGAAPMYDDLTI